jgi:hypothetical protein
MYRSRSILSFGAVLLWGCGDMPVVEESAARPTVPAEVKKHLDEKTIAVLAGATRVEVFRLGEAAGAPDQAKAETLDGFPVAARGKEQGKEFAGNLTKVLLDEKTYSTTFAACFMPGVAFRVWKGEECVDVVVCFKCSNFYCGPKTTQAQENACFADSPAAAAALVRLAKEALPDDKEIQALKEK